MNLSKKQIYFCRAYIVTTLTACSCGFPSQERIEHFPDKGVARDSANEAYTENTTSQFNSVTKTNFASNNPIV